MKSAREGSTEYHFALRSKARFAATLLSSVNSRVQPFVSVPTPHPLRRLRPSGCPALDDSAGQAPLTPPSPQKSPLRAEWRGEGGTLRPAPSFPPFFGHRVLASSSR